MAFKRSDWNDLIDAVNEVLQNPPDGCNPLPTIAHVGPGTIWRKSHIRQVQDAIKATCDDITFGPVPDLWEQSIVDEINNKLEQAWCNCDECNHDTVMAENGMEFLLYDNGPPIVVSPCLGNDTPDIPLRDLINAMQFGQSGIVSRIWRVFRRNHRNDGGISQAVIATGVITCEGIVNYAGSATVATAAGVFVSCSDCHSQVCADTLANAAAILGEPGNFYNTYVLVIDSTHADCADCDGGHHGGGGGE